MNNTIDEELNRIKADLATILSQDCDDLDSTDFIKHKALLLRTRIRTLKDKIGLEFGGNKEFKLAYQKLHKSLDHLQTALHYKMPLNPSRNDLKHQIKLIKEVQNEINNL